MSDDMILRKLHQQARRIGQILVTDRPAIRLPYCQRVLNPFPLGSSGGQPGDFIQSGPLTLLAFNVAVFVVTTNNGTNFWTLTLVDTAGTTRATVSTAAIAANTWTRLADLAPSQPATTNPHFQLTATATLNPGAIYIAPELIAAM